jgi:ribonuclease P protein component
MQGRRVRTAYLDVRYAPSAAGQVRAGVIVPLYSHSAVARNRVKRRLREIVRVDVLPLLTQMDIVVRALPLAYGTPFGVLRDDLLRTGGQIAETSAQ